MRLRNFLRIFSLLFLLLLRPNFIRADSVTPEPYRENEFPQFLKDVRRFEIITLGALPFVSIQTTLGYSTYQYFNHNFESSYFPNPFAASSYSQEEQIGILLTSLGICVGIGLTDLIIQIVRRNNAKKRSAIQDSDLMITPVTDNSSKMPVPPPSGSFDNPPPYSVDFGDEDGVELIDETVEADVQGAE